MPILLPDDADLRATVAAFQRVQQELSASCFNDGQPLSALASHRKQYRNVAGTLNSQMTCTAIRLSAGAYASACSDWKPTKEPFALRRARALFWVGKRGRDADFRQDGTLWIWTVAGRKRICFQVPEVFKQTWLRPKRLTA